LREFGSEDLQSLSGREVCAAFCSSASPRGLLLTAASGILAGDSGKEADKEKVARLIKQLGDRKFTKREAASKELAEIGEPALTALQEATASTDLEIGRRAERLVQTIIQNGVGPRDGEVFVLVNANSERCLTVRRWRGGGYSGAIIQGPFAEAAGPSARWKVVRVGDYYKLVNQESGKVLAVPEGSQQQGKILIEWEDLGSKDDAQRWEFVKVGKHYSIKSRVSGFVVAVGASRTEENANVIQWEMAEIPDQIWRLHWIPGAGKK
jgi:hypothetical protein